MVAETICPNLLREYEHIQKEQPLRVDFDRPQTRRLQIMKDFCRNCRLRQAYEKTLRQQQGLQPSDPVSVPSPGVPLLPSDDGGELESTTSSGGGDSALWNDDAFYEPTQRPDDDSQWADSFTTDQEDQQRE